MQLCQMAGPERKQQFREKASTCTEGHKEEFHDKNRID